MALCGLNLLVCGDIPGDICPDGDFPDTICPLGETPLGEKVGGVGGIGLFWITALTLGCFLWKNLLIGSDLCSRLLHSQNRGDFS